MSLLQSVRQRRAPRARAIETPAPTMGWNVRDAQSGMDIRYAIQLDNWFPEADSVRMRRGHTEHADIDAQAGTLYAYDYAGTQKLLAFTDAKIIDVTSASTSDLATGLSEGFWSTTTQGGYGIFVNGIDDAYKYNGTLSTTTFTGLAGTAMYGVHSHKHRLYAWAENATSFYYSGVDAIAGAMTEFDLAYVGNFRGHIQAMGSWTFDGGAGVDDVLAIITSQGQAYIYSGSNPGDANDWSLVGIFDIGGHPLGRRCIQKYGGDLIVVTESGYFPLSKALTLGNVSTAVTVSDVINGAITDLCAAALANSEYWQILLRGTASTLIVNVPCSQIDGNYNQHVMNTRTGAWCRYTGMNASCWAELGGNLYFADVSTSTIFQADTGDTDNGADISATAQQAYTSLGIPQVKKTWTMLRPVIQKDNATDVGLALGVDFGEVPGFAPISGAEGAGVLWGAADATWDEAAWAEEGIVQDNWQSVYGIGYQGSVALKVATQESDIRWYGTGHMVKPGGMI